MSSAGIASHTRRGPASPLEGLSEFRWDWLWGGYVTKSAPQTALKLITGGELTFGERVVLHRVGRLSVFTCTGRGISVRPSSPHEIYYTPGSYKSL